MSRVVLVHGFTQTGDSWAPVAEALAADHEVRAPDAPGHGANAAVHADLVEGARLVGAAGGRGAYVGYSMGGRLALHLAVAQPETVTALVLLGATGGIEDPDERVARRDADEALAARLERIGTDAFLVEWLAQPLFVRLPPGGGGARSTDAAGLAASLRLAGTGTQAPLWHRLHELSMPVLVLAGEHDEKFRRLGERLAAAVGANAELAVVPDAGHAAHLEQPAAFLDIVRPWLAAHA